MDRGTRRLSEQAGYQEFSPGALAGLRLQSQRSRNSFMQTHDKKMLSLGGCPPSGSMAGETSALYERPEAPEDL